MRTFVVRSLILVVGVLSVLWAIAAIRVYSNDGYSAAIADSVLVGEKFGPKQLDFIRKHLGSQPRDAKQASAARGGAVLRMLLLESELNAENHKVSVADNDQVKSSLRDALSKSPTDSFLWLSAFWLARLRGEPTASDFKLLRMSYESGRYEGWIIFKRIPLAFASFGSLPPDLIEPAFSDFLNLVRSRFYWEAAGMLEGPGWAIRDQLMKKLLLVDLSDRRGFARALVTRDIPGVSVPGVVEERTFRPF